jgi:hypothetical protein
MLHAWKSLTRRRAPSSMMLLATTRYSDQGKTAASTGIYAAVAPACKQWDRAAAGPECGSLTHRLGRLQIGSCVGRFKV